MTHHDPLNRGVLAGMLGLYLALAVVACAWIAWRSGAEGIRALATDAWAGAALGAGMAAAGVTLSALGSRAFAWCRAMETELRGVLGRLSIPRVLLLALSSGVGEELFFRGALQRETGWVAAGLIFGLLHVPVKRTLVPWTAFATGVGLLFGWVADRTGGIVAVTVAHAGLNAVNLWRLCGRGDAGRGDRAGPEPRPHSGPE